MAKALRTAGAIVAGAALIVATGGFAALAVGGASLGAAAGAALSATTFGLSTTAWLTAGSLLSSLGAGLSKPQVGDIGKGTQVDWKADVRAGIPYVIGETGTAGQIVFANTAEAKNHLLAYLTVHSLGPIEGVVGFRADGQALTFSSDNAVEAPYHDHMWERRQLGDLTPASFLPPAVTPGTGMPEWTTDHKLTGLAAQWWVLAYDKNGKVYPTGTPKPLSILKGVKVYDPRLDDTYPGGAGACRPGDEGTYVYSQNPFLHALTYALGRFHNGRRVAGLGVPISWIDVPAFVEGANVADANGWKVGGVAYTTDRKVEVFKAMLQAGGGRMTSLGAKISCTVLTPKVSLETLTGADLVGAADITGAQPQRDRYNAVTPTYRSADHDYQLVPAAPIEVAGYLAEDGDELHTMTPEFPLVPDVDQAAELGVYAVANSREFGPIILPCKPRWRGFRPGDCITVDEPDLGMNGQKALIVSRQRDWATGTVTLTLVSETDGKHAFALGQTGTAPPTPGLTGYDAGLLDAPDDANYTLNGETFSSPDGDIPALTVTGTNDNPMAVDLVVRFRPVASSAWASFGPVNLPDYQDDVRVELTGVTPNTLYQAEIAYRSVKGVLSDWTPLGTAVAGVFDLGAGAAVPPSPNLWRKQDYVVSGGASSIDPAFGTANWGLRFPQTAGAATVSGKIFGLWADTHRYGLRFRAKLTSGAGSATLRARFLDAGNNPISDLPAESFTVTTAEQMFEWGNIRSDDPDFVTAKFQIYTDGGDVGVGQVIDVADIQVVYGAHAPLGFSPSPDDPEALRLYGFTGAFDATRNQVYRQSSAPVLPTNGDIWVDTSTDPAKEYHRVAGTWQLASTIGAVFGQDVREALSGAIAALAAFKTALGTAALISGQGPWATEGTLTPTIVNGKLVWIGSDGVIRDYRGTIPNFGVDGVVARTGVPLSSTSSGVTVTAHNVYLPQPSGGGGYTVLAVPGTSFGGLSADTTYTVFWHPVANVWACSNPSTTYAYRASADGWMEIGAIRTQTGGGTYNPPNYGSGGVIGFCVDADAWLGPGRRAGDAKAGDPLTLLTPDGERAFVGAIEKIVQAQAERLRLRTAAGAALTVSTTAPIMVRDEPGQLPWAIRAEAARPGILVPIGRGWGEGEARWDVVTAIEPLGPGRVARISAGNGIFAATDDPAAPPLFTHNGYNKP